MLKQMAQSFESKCEEDGVDGGGGPASVQPAQASW